MLSRELEQSVSKPLTELFLFRFSFSSINPDESLRLSPERGNVAFASTQMGWVFTLRSFAQMYSDTYGECGLRIHKVPY